MKFRCFSSALLVHTSGFRQSTSFPLWPRPQQEQIEHSLLQRGRLKFRQFLHCVIFVLVGATTINRATAISLLG